MAKGKLIVVTDDTELLKKVDLYTPDNFPEPSDEDDIVFVSDNPVPLTGRLAKFKEKIIHVKFPQKIKSKIWGNYSFTTFLWAELAKKGFFSKEVLNDVRLRIPPLARRKETESEVEEESYLLFMGISEEKPSKLEFLGILPYRFHANYTYFYFVGWDNELEFPVFYRHRIIKHFDNEKAFKTYKNQLLKVVKELKETGSLDNIQENLNVTETEVEIFKLTISNSEIICEWITNEEISDLSLIREKLKQLLIQPDEILKSLGKGNNSMNDLEHLEEENSPKNKNAKSYYFKGIDNFFQRKELNKVSLSSWEGREEDIVLLWDKSIFEEVLTPKDYMLTRGNIPRLTKIDLDDLIHELIQLVKKPKEQEKIVLSNVIGRILEILNRGMELTENDKEKIPPELFSDIGLIGSYGEFCCKQGSFSEIEEEYKEEFLKYLIKWGLIVFLLSFFEKKEKGKEKEFESFDAPIGDEENSKTLHDLTAGTYGEEEQKIVDVRIKIDEILEKIKPNLEEKLKPLPDLFIEEISAKDNVTKLLKFICISPYIPLIINNILFHLKLIGDLQDKLNEDLLSKIEKIGCIFDGRLEKINELDGEKGKDSILHQTDAEYRNALMFIIDTNKDVINKINTPVETIIGSFIKRYLNVDYIKEQIKNNLYSRAGKVELIYLQYENFLKKFVSYFKGSTGVDLNFETAGVTKKETQKYRTRCSRVLNKELKEKIDSNCSELKKLIIEEVKKILTTEKAQK